MREGITASLVKKIRFSFKPLRKYSGQLLMWYIFCSHNGYLTMCRIRINFFMAYLKVYSVHSFKFKKIFLADNIHLREKNSPFFFVFVKSLKIFLDKRWSEKIYHASCSLVELGYSRVPVKTWEEKTVLPNGPDFCMIWIKFKSIIFFQIFVR